ncbi:hypothetical protein [Nonomuraea sp. CA-141351]|uniref:hypothetical protein n=1 Tax=Nonomuraea sp. CA-141351 TaxID=3239996 RepID=UPI003D92F008
MSGALAAWFVVTLFSQHPRRRRDRLRALVPGGLVPDWRLFAPEPVQRDYVLVHRTVEADGGETPWRVTAPISGRSWRQFVWFPQRRAEKAIHEIADELLAHAAAQRREWSGHHTFGLLRDHVLRRVRQEYADSRSIAVGAQFGVLRSGGHDHTAEEELVLVSPFISCLEGAVGE